MLNMSGRHLKTDLVARTPLPEGGVVWQVFSLRMIPEIFVT